MVLFEVNAVCVAFAKFKCNAPWTVDVDGVTPSCKSFQRVEVKAWNIHVFCLSRSIERVQPLQDTFMQPAVNP